MSRRPGPDVAVWGLAYRDDRPRPRPWLVRWRVGETHPSKSFTTKVPADEYRSRLITAVSDGLRFDEATGLPEAWAVSGYTFATWTKTWFDEEQLTWSPRARHSVAQTLAPAMLVVVDARASEPAGEDRVELVRACKMWLAGTGEQPAWVKKHSLRLDQLDETLCARFMTTLSLRLNLVPTPGNPSARSKTLLAASTVKRTRSIIQACLRLAVTRRQMEANPWPGPPTKRNKTQQKSNAIDPTLLPTIEIVDEILGHVVTHQPGSRGHLVLFQFEKYTGARPSEVRALKVENCNLPERGWGSARIVEADKDAGSLWTPEGEAEGDTKTGKHRTIPLHPSLVAILRDHLGERRTGLVVATRSGGLVTMSNLSRSLSRSMEAAGYGDRDWSMYTLRHLYATRMLRGHAPQATVAKYLGHSVEVLWSTYCDVMEGDDGVAVEVLFGLFD